MIQSIVLIAGNPIIELDENDDLVEIDTQPWALEMAIRRVEEIQACSDLTVSHIYTLLDHRGDRGAFLKDGGSRRRHSGHFLADLRDDLRPHFESSVAGSQFNLEKIKIMWEGVARQICLDE